LVSISLENLSKSFGKVKAVDGIDLRINDQEFLTFLGPSGCGKTTLLRMIAGLEAPTEGYIRMDDEIVNDFSPRERNVAMVFQSYALYPHMTAFDNIAFPLQCSKVPKDEIRRRVEGTAKMLGIDQLLDRKPKELSGGQRQRVALGRAIVRKPRVYLMDEPLSNLDAQLRVHMRAELVRLQKALKTTLIFVTHDQMEAMTMSDRIALVNEGKIHQVDTPDGTYNRPADTWVAGFIGSPPMNFIDCELTTRGNKTVLNAGEFTIEISEDLGNMIRKRVGSSELSIGIRPEDITIGKEKKPGSVECKIYLLESIGDSVIIDFVVGKLLLRAKVAAPYSGKIEETINCSFNEHRIHVFDKKTGKNILQLS